MVFEFQKGLRTIWIIILLSKSYFGVYLGSCLLIDHSFDFQNDNNKTEQQENHFIQHKLPVNIHHPYRARVTVTVV